MVLAAVQASLGPYAWETPQHDQGGAGLDTGNHPLLNGDCNGLPLDIDMPDYRRSRSPRSRAHHGEPPPYLQDEELSKLERTQEVFELVERESHMSYKLPKPGATAGQVLRHASCVFETLMSKHSPMSFKFGITHNPVFRWYHKPWGYKHGVEKYENLVVLYASSSCIGPAFLEAALIDKFGSRPASIKKLSSSVANKHVA